MTDFKGINSTQTIIPERNGPEWSGGFIPNSTPYGFNGFGPGSAGDKVKGSRLKGMPSLERPTPGVNMGDDIKAGLDSVRMTLRAELEAMEERRKSSTDPRETMFLIRLMIVQLMKERMGIIIETVDTLQDQQKEMGKESVQEVRKAQEAQDAVDKSLYYGRSTSWAATGALAFATVAGAMSSGADGASQSSLRNAVFLGVGTKVLMESGALDAVADTAAENVLQPMGMSEEDAKKYAGGIATSAVVGANLLQLWSGWGVAASSAAVAGQPGFSKVAEIANEVNVVANLIAQGAAAKFNWDQNEAEIRQLGVEGGLEDTSFEMDLYDQYLNDLLEKISAIIEGASSELRNERSTVGGIIDRIRVV